MNITFSRRTELALSAFRTLAAADSRMSRGDLAQAIGTTTSYLPQVMGPLVQKGWIRSGRGPGGGYELTDAAADARYLQVVESSEGPTHNGRCVLREGPCPGDETCPVHEVWAEARQVLIDRFGAMRVLEQEKNHDTATRQTAR